MKKILLIAVSVVLVNVCYSQEDFLKISGKIIDSKTREPLIHANISVSKTSIGTVSNILGEFDFFVPIVLKDDTLVISYVGYKTFRKIIIGSTTLSIFGLEEEAVVLNEVVVSSDGAKRLVEDATKSIPLVYPTQPYLFEGFHRSWEKIDFTDSITYPGTLIESAVTIYDPGYGQKKESPKSAEEIYLMEVRRSAIMEGWEYGGNMLKQLLQQNLLRHTKSNTLFVKSFLDFPNSFSYEWDGSTKINNENVSIIKVEIPNSRNVPAYFRIYISENDKAILRFELHGGQKEIEFSKYDWHTDNVNATYIFKRYLGKPYLSYCILEYTIKKLDLVKKKVIRTEDYFKELLVNNVIDIDVEEKRKALGPASKGNSLAMQAKPYNQEFWENFNLIKENPVDTKIISLFEKQGKLENQFKSKSKKKNQ